MEAAPVPTSCEIARLPEDLLAASIACTGPRDACRAAAVSPTFRAAADSDAVWALFLPRDLPPLADGELSPTPPSKKALFTRLADSPVLLADGLTSMWLDRETGAKCYMLSARALCIIWGDTSQYWHWIPLTDSRFSEAAELRAVCWLEIRGKIPCKMLSQNSTYAVNMVFKMSDESYGLEYPLQEASVSIGEAKFSRHVCLDGYQSEGEGEDGEEVPQNYRSLREWSCISPRKGLTAGWRWSWVSSTVKMVKTVRCPSVSWRQEEATGRKVLLCRALKFEQRNRLGRLWEVVF